MNRDTLRKVVEKHRGRFYPGRLYARPDRFCIIGACLYEAGVPRERLLCEAGDGAGAIWSQHREELLSQGVESPEEGVRLMKVNDKLSDAAAHTSEAIESRLLNFLERGWID